MKNLRIVYDNAADRATLSSTKTFRAGMGIDKLVVDDKFQVCRSIDQTFNVTAKWPQGETIGAVVLPFTNMSPTAVIKVTTPQGYDSGWILACPAPSTRLRGWAADKSASAYGYGGGACARVWITPALTNVTEMTVHLYDENTVQGYVEASRLVIGDYWEPEQGVEQGATITSVDTSKQYRTEAGSLLTDVGTKYKKQSLPMPWLSGTDRAAFWDILVGNGLTAPMFISVHPNATDVNLERMHQMYGKLVTTPIMSTPYWDANSATLEFEEV